MREPRSPSQHEHDQARRVSRSELWNRVFIVVVGAAVLLVIFLSFQQQASTHAQGVTLIRIAEQNRANGERLIDCTTPGHACYDDARKGTAATITALNEVTILAAFCAHQPANTTEAKIRTCIEHGLKEKP